MSRDIAVQLGEALRDRYLLERKLGQGGLMFTRAAATWDPVREDPRYLALLKRLRLDF